MGDQGQKGGYPIRNADMTPETGELERLRAGNARLHAVLEAHGIDFPRSLAEPVALQQSEAPRLGTDEKVALFRRLFQGRTDVYPVRWLANQATHPLVPTSGDPVFVRNPGSNAPTVATAS